MKKLTRPRVVALIAFLIGTFLGPKAQEIVAQVAVLALPN